jgi:hypothetical protein
LTHSFKADFHMKYLRPKEWGILLNKQSKKKKTSVKDLKTRPSAKFKFTCQSLHKIKEKEKAL